MFARGKLRFSHILSFTSLRLLKPVASSFSKTLPLRGDLAYIILVGTDISDKISGQDFPAKKKKNEAADPR